MKNAQIHSYHQYPNRLGCDCLPGPQERYPIGLKPDPRLISSLRLKHSNTLPKWNYTIAPNL